MRLSHFALVACLFALPVTATATFSTATYAATTVSELGDLSAMRTIVADAPAAISDAALTALLARLDNPGATNAAGVVTTDTSGKPLPYEDMLAQYRAVQPKAASLDDATKAKIAELESKGLERCNADDDKRADDFFGQAIQLIGA